MLDVNTTAGQKTLTDEARAVELFTARYKQHQYVHTDKSTAAKIDAVLVRDGGVEGLVLTSCRYNCSLLKFQLTWGNEWLLTYRKLAIGALLAKHMQTRLLGFIYIVDDDLLLIQRLYNPLANPQWQTQIRTDRTETQATVNGGRMIRRNAFIKIDKAIQVRPLVNLTNLDQSDQS